MAGTRSGFVCGLLIAAFIISFCGTASAQDMPPILVPLAPAPVVAPTPPPAPISPSAEAVLPPAPIAAPVKPAEKPQTSAVPHLRAAHYHAKVASAKKHLAAPHHIAHVEHRVAAHLPGPALPPGMPVSPPGYYGPGYYGPGPYRHLVYGGPPPGFYGGWGYRGPYPDYP